MMEWYGDAWVESLKSKLASNMQKAGEEAADLIYRRISTPYPPASRPFSPPHVRTSRLRDSYGAQTEVGHDSITTWLTTTSPYALELERGNPGTNLLPRPHIVSTIEQDQHWEWLQSIIFNI